VREEHVLVVRPARPSDLDAIMEVERQSYGGHVSEDSVAAPEIMEQRIALCNQAYPGWFWVVCEAGQVTGYFILQPTQIPPEHCASWAQATGGGRMTATFDPGGPYVYGVSVGSADGARAGTTHALFAALHKLRVLTGKEILYACARMSGFAEASRASGISAEDYWRQRSHRLPRDPFLRHFEDALGLRPRRLLVNGYPPDTDSGGHGVLCVSDDPQGDLARNERRLKGLHIILREEPLATPAPDTMSAALCLGEDLDEKLAGLRGREGTWYDVASGQWVSMATLYLAQGCPDWGERGGERNELCSFCALPNAARLYREAFFGGRSLTADEHYGLFAENLAHLSSPHTLCVFNAGSFLAPQANPVELQERIVRRVAAHPTIQRLVIESRAELITPKALEPLAAILAAVGKGLTIRVGVETQDDHLRLKKLRKGHTRARLSAATQTMAHARVTPGAYCLLNPAPRLAPRWAVDEAEATLHWVLGELGFAEAYFCATCVAPATPLERAWRAGEFAPASLWEVWEVLRRTVSEYGRRIHLLPFVDEPSLVAIPSNHVSTGIPEDLRGATGCDLQFHRFLAEYRSGVVSAEALLGSSPECSCRPSWIK
jgi:radical SAM enzyme (TIGR01210 family)